MPEKIAVIGLGYVGLPLALALAAKFEHVYGFDINENRIHALQNGQDDTQESDPDTLKQTSLTFTAKTEDLQKCNFFIVSVPTPIDQDRQPDLSPLLSASHTVGKALKKGDIVVFESTVYPGVTEDICGPVLAKASGLIQGKDFKLGYSPERINPGDKKHTLEKIVKVVSGEDPETLEHISKIYGRIIDAGLHKAPSIKIAEAAKSIENIQRDINIALMNELAVIFDRLNIRTADVLEAARSKWNFLPFSPGLVGGHCIGVDPYYLTSCAEKTGYYPEVILSGRRINDGMSKFIAQKAVKLLSKQDIAPSRAKIGILGLTFKENVPDLRNSKVPDILHELQTYGIHPLIHDPLADPEQAQEEYGITLSQIEEFKDLDILILAVAHKNYLKNDGKNLQTHIKKNAIIMDVKSALTPENYRDTIYWSL